mmetsp:Transcript_20796/g.51567  ORF Transcript_20796/g.51567 Transcript_20796/m.51567 type:complete len:273 (-) Transcript_20796:152-970(-)
MSLLSVSRIKSSASHSLVRWAAGGWTLFVVENAVLSENRTWLIDSMGDDNYHAFYGTLSTIATVSIGYAYYKITRKAPPIPPQLRRWKAHASPPIFACIGSWICTSVGLVMASQVAPTFQIPVSLSRGTDGSPQMNLQVRCPFDFNDKRLDSNDPFLPRGTERISRHPGLWSFGLMGMGQSFLAPTVPLQIWWLGPALVAWLGGNHTDSRFRRGLGGTLNPEYDSQTSNIPFVAMITGRQTNSWGGLGKELKPVNTTLAIVTSSLWVLRRMR